ncbi:hypothetical protein MKW94_028569 [Papaver nudicaule]|uniref:Leucine-rich repeat-containing N-terminal plant-type domain-containing protein n=1 Tax=Papaver nudicaule TaxID=74823 RepID=A0AA41VTA5_PAPNU|nr:hypothetical protein [Papaver nudicaule]
MSNSSKIETKFFQFSLVVPVFVFIFMISNGVVALEDDIRCLKGIKAAFADPQGGLESWTFDNSSPGLICQVSGVECWNRVEDRLISVSLPTSELSGQIPDSIQYCASLYILDLADNKISGTIPPKLCTWLPYLTTLDLSGNQLSGEIPANLGDCLYLNKLRLSSNLLSGHIPYELASLPRLVDFTVANNDLSGPIPFNSSSFSRDAFDGNNGLCGGPLGSLCDVDQPFAGCEKNDGLCRLMVYSAVVLGFIVGFWGLFFVLLIKKEKWWFGYWSFVDTVALGFIGGFRAPVLVLRSAVHNFEDDDHQVFVLVK